MRSGVVPVGLVCWLAGGAAWAGNSAHDPTPVRFTDAPCVARVERADGDHAIGYTIPAQDVVLTCDEPPDSRRHQFVALDVPRDPAQPFPAWLTTTDVEGAISRGIIDPADVTMDDVLETHGVLAGAWYRITPDDPRRPITCEAAAQGVMWDTRDVPVGVYTIHGYTWEPPRNNWVRRAGVVKIVETDPTPEQDLPAAALQIVDSPVYSGETATLRLCFDGLPDSTYTLYARPTEEPDWGPPVTSDQMIVSADDDIEFTPLAIDGSFDTFVFRVDVTDPLGRRHTAHGSGSVLAFVGDPPDTGTGGKPCDPADPYCEDTDGDACRSESGPADGGTYEASCGETGTSSSSTSGMTDAGSAGEGSAGPGADQPSGCGCGAPGAPVAPCPMLPWWRRRGSRTA